MLDGETTGDAIAFLPFTDVAPDSDDFATHIAARHKVGFLLTIVCTTSGYIITILFGYLSQE